MVFQFLCHKFSLGVIPHILGFLDINRSVGTLSSAVLLESV